MIEFKKVSKSYDKKVLHNLSFKIADGNSMGIFGKSGIGKTTILKLLLNLEKADQGFIETNFTNASVVFQENRLINEISALDNLKLIENDEQLLIDTLKRFGINDVNQKIYLLSGGMQRKVALARAYVFDGDILIMDEPFTGIDYASKSYLASTIKERFMGKSIIIVSHNTCDFELFDIKKDNILFL